MLHELFTIKQVCARSKPFSAGAADMEAGLQAVGGNTALALLLVIATNLGGIFTMPVRAQPPSLNQTLHSVFAHLQLALQTAL